MRGCYYCEKVGILAQGNNHQCVSVGSPWVSVELATRLASLAATQAARAPKSKQNAALFDTREYDIISTAYYHDHETRTQQEQQAALEAAAAAFRKQNDFDPITAHYYDKERDVRMAR